jgi:D-arginine dehydrogenase
MSAAIGLDFIVVGGGIAGASVAAWLAPHGRVVVLERESQPGYHATGRSAALFMASYGTPQVRALTRASRAFFDQPPPGFADLPLLAPRGALFVATLDQRPQLDAHWAMLQTITREASLLSPAQACAMVPVLRPELLAGAVYEGDACDIDVHALHQGYLRWMRQSGATLVCNAEVIAVERAGGEWLVRAGDQTWRAPVLVNAAGAWADTLAGLAGVAPLGVEPRRRSALLFAPPAGLDTRAWPMVIGADEDWYFKPDAGQLLGSPANADPVPAQDVQPEELDIALAIARIETITTLSIPRPSHTWAGLRSFVADGDLVGGFDPGAPGFFWLAAQGGYGIQTSPAMGQACAALARGLPLPAAIADFGLTAAMLSPERLSA